MAKYVINKDVRNQIQTFLKSAVDSAALLEKEELEESEINLIISALGMYPAFSTYQLIDSLRGGSKRIEDEQSGK